MVTMVTCPSSRLAPLVSRGAPSGALRPRPLTRAQRHRRCPARGVLGLGTGQEFDTFDACGFSVGLGIFQYGEQPLPEQLLAYTENTDRLAASTLLRQTCDPRGFSEMEELLAEDPDPT